MISGDALLGSGRFVVLFVHEWFASTQKGKHLALHPLLSATEEEIFSMKLHVVMITGISGSSRALANDLLLSLA